MQTILGASGQIGHELAVSLKHDLTSDIRLVSRRPQKVNETDQLLNADLLDAAQTMRAIEGSEIVYLTVGLSLVDHCVSTGVDFRYAPHNRRENYGIDR